MFDVFGYLNGSFVLLLVLAIGLAYNELMTILYRPMIVSAQVETPEDLIAED